MNEALLVLDIGGGTQDILLLEPGGPLENAVKLVLPSPTVVAARRIRKATQEGRALFLTGRVMGGGAVSTAIRNHLKAGLMVYSQKEPALTIHDDLGKVAGLGVRLVDQPPEPAARVELGDLDLAALAAALAPFEVSLPDRLALALQDHGFSPHFSNRLTRFAQWRRFLDGGGDLAGLLYPSVPPELTRWAAAARTAPGAWFMDTAGAALRGAVLDDWAAERLGNGLLVINAGNEHTVAFLIRNRTVFGVYEHHTSLLDTQRLQDHMARFARAGLDHQEIFDQWGHGVAYRPDAAQSGPFGEIVVTGPRRALAQALGHLAAPYGEMMLSGCFGLVAAVTEIQTQSPA
jgi:uncharacterized protein (DUF1786 family)